MKTFLCYLSLLLLVPFICSGGFFKNPLDGMRVAHFGNYVCPPAPTNQRVAFFRDIELTFITEPTNQCVAFERELAGRWKLCCRDKWGKLACLYMKLGAADRWSVGCREIFNMSGQPYKPEDVIDWNRERGLTLGGEDGMAVPWPETEG